MDCVAWMKENLILMRVHLQSDCLGLIQVHEKSVSGDDCSACGDNFDPYNVGKKKVCDPSKPEECQVHIPDWATIDSLGR